LSNSLKAAAISSRSASVSRLAWDAKSKRK